MAEGIRGRGVDKLWIQKVIITEALIGRGTDEDPARTLTQYWSLEGVLLAQRDTWKEAQER